MRSAQNVEQNPRLNEPDAGGSRHQYPDSALLVSMGHPATIYNAWQEGHFTLLVCAEQLDELRATLRKPAIAIRIKPHKAGRLVNELKVVAETINALPQVRRSPDPTDDFLLAVSQAGKAAA